MSQWDLCIGGAHLLTSLGEQPLRVIGVLHMAGELSALMAGNELILYALFESL